LTNYWNPGRSFAELIGKPWMAPALAELFMKARKACQERVR
jgi:hypothetical protein